MPSTRSRSGSVLPDEELRLPRPPGIIRRFWARHPLLTDILIALFCLVLTIGPLAGTRTGGTDASGETFVELPIWSPVPAALLAVAAVFLVWRRRWPVAVFALAIVASASFLFVTVPAGGPVIFVATYTLAVYRSSRACWIGVAVGIGGITALAAALAAVGAITWQIAANGAIGEFISALIGALIGVNIGNRRRYVEAIIDRSRQLLVERDQQALLAAAGERARIAREMHDIVSHSLTVIVALSEGAAATDDVDRAREANRAAARTARGALTEMRAMLGVLRESTSGAPLAPASPTTPDETVDIARRAGFPVTLTTSGDLDLPQPVRYAIGRIVQEGVTNAMRHAPAARFIAVGVDRGEGRVTITVRNDGVTDAATDPGFGIRGLGERAIHVGGSLRSTRSGPGEWTLRAVLPVDGTRDDRPDHPDDQPPDPEEAP